MENQLHVSDSVPLLLWHIQSYIYIYILFFFLMGPFYYFAVGLPGSALHWVLRTGLLGLWWKGHLEFGLFLLRIMGTEFIKMHLFLVGFFFVCFSSSTDQANAKIRTFPRVLWDWLDASIYTHLVHLIAPILRNIYPIRLSLFAKNRFVDVKFCLWALKF